LLYFFLVQFTIIPSRGHEVSVDLEEAMMIIQQVKNIDRAVTKTRSAIILQGPGAGGRCSR